MRALLTFALLPVTLTAQEPLPLTALPPDTAIIIGARPSKIIASSAWKQLVAAEKKANPTLAIDVTDAKNVDEIVVAVPGTALRSRVVMLVRADCKGELASRLCLRSRERRGVELSTACLPGGITVLGDPESLKSVQAGARNPGPAKALLASAEEVRGSNDVWIVTNASVDQLAKANPNRQAAAAANSPMLKSIRQISFGLNLSAGVRASVGVQTATPGDAEMFAGGMLMALGMLKSDPKNGARAAPIVDRIKVHAAGNTASLELNVPEQEYALFASQLQAAAGPALAAANPGTLTITGGPESGVMAPASTPTPSRSGGIVIHSSPKDMGTVELPR
ncbi:MAG: hypothetical protein ACM3ZB_07565 [bacterium]|jgi:hypothetical protein